MKITTILFDFVGVLLELDPSVVVSQQVEMIDRQVGKVINDRASNSFGNGLGRKKILFIGSAGNGI